MKAQVCGACRREECPRLVFPSGQGDCPCWCHRQRVIAESDEWVDDYLDTEAAALLYENPGLTGRHAS